MLAYINTSDNTYVTTLKIDLIPQQEILNRFYAIPNISDYFKNCIAENIFQNLSALG